MRQSIFVISDLHLGGAAATAEAPGFRMCGDATLERLAEFMRWTVTQGRDGRTLRLVLAGDIVDFLAEKDFAPFTAEDKAVVKLRRVLAQTAGVWSALRDAMKAGLHVTFLLGNHDIELSLPAVRRVLLDELAPGMVDFLYDNEAFVAGPLIVEHGNRYDSWNAVSHDQLRVMRSTLSRREPARPFSPPAGSLLVTSVMNDLKSRYAFIDLLKPETAALLPLLAVLEPKALGKIHLVARTYIKSLRTRFDATGVPVNPDLAGGATREGEAHRRADREEAAQRDAARREARENVDLASTLAGAASADKAGLGQTFGAFVDVWRAATASDAKEQVRRLRRALVALRTDSEATFDVTIEDAGYLRPVRRLAASGFRVVVFGHTHLAKRVVVDDRCTYLNTGTWADLMRIPREAYGNDARAEEVLADFAADLAANRTEKYRRTLPTFARIDLSDDTVDAAEVYVFGDPPIPLPNRILES